MKRKTNKTSKKSNGGVKSKKNTSSRFSPKNRRSGEYVSKKPISDIMSGTIQGSGKGFAFFIPDDGSGDIFIPAKALNGAMHGDKVNVVKVSQQRGNGEGEVVEVTTPKYDSFTGVYKGDYILPDDKSMGDYIPIDYSVSSKISPAVGDKVYGNLIRGKGGAMCTVTEILGRNGDLTVEVMAVIRSFKLRERFNKNIAAEVKSIPDEVLDSDLKGRTDYRNQNCITIDGDDSKDFDDAVFVEKTGGGYKLFVHIADVAHYVTTNTAIDSEAFKRGTSVYFADRVLPMLPEKLSNGICSLNEKVDRLVLTAEMEFDENGDRIAYAINEGVINSSARMTYKNVQKILDGDKELAKKYKNITPMLITAEELAHILNQKRKNRGSVNFESTESDIIIENNEVVDVRRADTSFSHKLIEEFMLAANETVAEHFEKLKVPFVYRVHEAPPPEKVNAFQSYLEPFGVEFPDEPSPSDYRDMLASLDDEKRIVISRMALRSMSKADYRPENLGHFGLAAEFYCHFTSPIRRYPDLSIHRIIKQYIHQGAGSLKVFNDFVRDSAKNSSLTERTAEEAERRIDNILKARFMSNKIGFSYKGIISGVTEWGLFVELENSIEGLVKIDTIKGGKFVFNDKLHRLDCGKKSYSIGKEVTVTVAETTFDKISFILSE